MRLWRTLCLDKGNYIFMKFGCTSTNKTAGCCKINVITVKITDDGTCTAHHLNNPHNIMRCQTVLDDGINVSSGQKPEIMTIPAIIGDFCLRTDFIERG